MDALPQIIAPLDRVILRNYLTERLRRLATEATHALDPEERAYADGARMEIEFAFDELLGEEPPEVSR
jgi:hypothetical protein